MNKKIYQIFQRSEIKEWKEREKWNRENSEMVKLYLNLSQIILNVNRWMTPIKRQRLSELKTDRYGYIDIFCLQKSSLDGRVSRYWK